MNDHAPLVRRLAQKAATLVASVGADLCEERQAWAAAMHAEIDHIENDADALRYAVGCYTVLFWEKQRMTHFQSILRPLFATALLGWAGAKIWLAYLVSGHGENTMPTWFFTAIVLAGVAYALCAVTVLARRHLIAGACFAAALAINWGQLSLLTLGMMQNGAAHVFPYAIIAEETFVWITFFLAGVFLYGRPLNYLRTLATSSSSSRPAIST